MQAKPDYYEVLGIGRTATEQEIKSAFTKIAAEFQAAGKPRSIGDVEAIRAIATAYRVLSTPDRRRRYDETGQGFIGDQDNQLTRSGPDKLDKVLELFEDLYENWGSSDYLY